MTARESQITILLGMAMGMLMQLESQFDDRQAQAYKNLTKGIDQLFYPKESKQ